jgi:RHS repeat-associated protein
VPAGLAFERAVTHTPVLAATVADPDGGAVDGQFFARRAGATSWDLANGTRVTVTSGAQARLTLPALPAGQAVEWQVASCDTTQCSAPTALQTAKVQPELGAGARKNATTLPFQIGDRVSATVDVGTGNLQVTATGLSAPGVTSDLPVDWAYNSLAIGSGGQADQDAPFGRGWMPSSTAVLTTETDGSVVLWSGSGQAATFTKTGTTFTPPAGITADLVAATGGGWTLTDHASQQKWTFGADGHLTSVADRNANTHTIGYGSTPGAPVSFSATRGGADLDVDADYDGGKLVELAQGPDNARRTVDLAYDGEDLASITDAEGRAITFTYTDHLLTSVKAPGRPATQFQYDDRGRVTAVMQNFADSWIRLAYSDTETLVSDPVSDRAGSPAVGPHTTYTLTADMLGRVEKAVDAEGRERSASYTANIDPATQTQGSGTGASTTSYGYDANAGESLTDVTTQGGAATTYEYANTAAASKYSPSSMTDDAGNSSLFTYNGTGNQLTSTDALAAESALTYNADGTVATATASGNTGNPTTYGYDANKQLVSITPPTGTSLGLREMTYDAYGRLATATNGAGETTTYIYNNKLDLLTAVDYASTTESPDITYDYDNAARLKTRVDASGTTTYSYDVLSRLTSRVHSEDFETVEYGYDKSSRLKTTTDGRGTTEYLYDDAGVQTAQVTRLNGDEAWTRFAIDDKGRRTDTWMRTNEDNTAWAAHSKTTYDASGRVSGIKAESAMWGSDITRVVDLTFCHSAGTTAPDCTASAANDRSMIQWRRDNITGQTASYTYDGANRLTGVSVTAGADGDGNPVPAETYTYTYDTRGNRLTATGPDGTQTRTYNAGNQTTTAGFAYDGAGNLIEDPEAGSLDYTAGDQLASRSINGASWTYQYAGLGNNELVTQTDPNGQDIYKYAYGRSNAQGKPIIESIYHAGSRAYLEHDANGTPLIMRGASGTLDGQSMYIYDNLGSPLTMVTQNNTTTDAWTYDPYGVADLTEQSPAEAYTPFMYTGGLNDRVTGWTLNGARYYDAGEGRWTQMDTLDAPLDPSNANRYAYAANNPVNFTDPTGLSRCALAGFAGGVLGAFAGTALGFGFGGPGGAALGGAAGAAVGAGLTAGACSSTKKTPAGRARDAAIGAGWAVAGVLSEIGINRLATS